MLLCKGKLKVLPEQQETPVIDVKSQKNKDLRFQQTPQNDEAAGTPGDSDEGDVDDSSDSEHDDVEVNCVQVAELLSNFDLHWQIYNQISLIPDGTAKRDALRLTKKKAKSLPRVTAYATARCVLASPFVTVRVLSLPGGSSYRMGDLMRFLNARRAAYHTNPKLIGTSRSLD